MNHVPRSVVLAELALAREVIERHPFPSFVEGYDVKLGDIEGDPAMWVTFRTTGDATLSEQEVHERVKARIALSDAVRRDLLDTIDGPYPYFYYRPV